MQSLRLYVATFNVGASDQTADLKDLLNLTSNNNSFVLPDVYITSFQEVKSQPQDMLKYALFDDPWTYACQCVLQTYDYVKIKSIRLQGIVLSVFCLRKHLLHIREIETQYTRTGLFGFWGNKGAVSIRLNMYERSVCIVNAHLSAHEHLLKDRIEDYNTIKHQEFCTEKYRTIWHNDYIFWMGDLNFRLLDQLDKSFEQVVHSILTNQIAGLLQYDQLRHVMMSGEAFSELCENIPTFPPTFKYQIGSNQYNSKRKPAWCDRILYNMNRTNPNSESLDVQQLSYRTHQLYNLSDHKPVTADFLIKVCAVDTVYPAIEFTGIQMWYLDQENIVKFRVKNSKYLAAEDWIGLYKANFSNIDEYISYEYVNIGNVLQLNRLHASNRCPNEATHSGHESTVEHQIVFSDVPNKYIGLCQLVYASQTKNKVTAILAISNSFPIVL